MDLTPEDWIQHHMMRMVAILNLFGRTPAHLIALRAINELDRLDGERRITNQIRK